MTEDSNNYIITDDSFLDDSNKNRVFPKKNFADFIDVDLLRNKKMMQVVQLRVNPRRLTADNCIVGLLNAEVIKNEQ